MPAMNGIEVVQNLSSKFIYLPVIMTTGVVTEFLREKIARFERIKVIKKPVDKEELLELLKTHLPNGGKLPVLTVIGLPTL